MTMDKMRRFEWRICLCIALALGCAAGTYASVCPSDDRYRYRREGWDRAHRPQLRENLASGGWSSAASDPREKRGRAGKRMHCFIREWNIRCGIHIRRASLGS